MKNITRKILGIILLAPMTLAGICMLAFMIVGAGWELLIVILALASACAGAYILSEIEN